MMDCHAALKYATNRGHRSQLPYGELTRKPELMERNAVVNS